MDHVPGVFYGLSWVSEMGRAWMCWPLSLKSHFVCFAPASGSCLRKGSSGFLRVRNQQNDGAVGVWPLNCALTAQNSWLTTCAFLFLKKHARFTFWSHCKRKKKVWQYGGEKLLEEEENCGLKVTHLILGNRNQLFEGMTQD